MAAACCSALLRTAISLEHRWRPLALSLVGARHSDLAPLAALSPRGSLNHDWDTPPIVTTLAAALDASTGFALPPAAVRGALVAAGEQRTSWLGPGRFKLQRSLYSALMESSFPDCVSGLLARRSAVLASAVAVPPERALALRQLLLAAPAHWGLGALRTWANGWTTSSRMHEALLLPCCACGAASADRLTHYLACPVLVLHRRGPSSRVASAWPSCSLGQAPAGRCPSHLGRSRLARPRLSGVPFTPRALPSAHLHRPRSGAGTSS